MGFVLCSELSQVKKVFELPGFSDLKKKKRYTIVCSLNDFATMTLSTIVEGQDDLMLCEGRGRANM